MNEADLRKHVEVLAGTPRVPGTREHAKAADYIHEQLEGFAYSVSRAEGLEGDCVVNVIAESGASDAPLFVVGAHYDSVVGSPGADDNASGVAAMLEVAREFAKKKSSTTRVQFVAYDQEEAGLVGSLLHCKALRKANARVIGMVSLEMLGYTDTSQTLVPGVILERQTGDFLALVANGQSGALLSRTEGIETKLPIERVVVQRGSEAAQLARLSDHGAFWAAGWPALLATDTAFLRNPHYHKPTDTPATLDYSFLKESAEAMLLMLQRLT